VRAFTLDLGHVVILILAIAAGVVFALIGFAMAFGWAAGKKRKKKK